MNDELKMKVNSMKSSRAEQEPEFIKVSYLYSSLFILLMALLIEVYSHKEITLYSLPTKIQRVQHAFSHDKSKLFIFKIISKKVLMNYTKI
jgi:hypothetical protein